MATIKYIVRGSKGNSNIQLRYSIARGVRLIKKTGYIIDVKDWSPVKAQPILRNEDLKILKTRLDKLSTFVETAYNEAINKGYDIDEKWLENQIDLFHEKKTVIDLDILVNFIQKYIDDAPYKENKGEIGLSEGRIRNLKLFKNTIIRFQEEIYKSDKILIKDVNLQFVEKFKQWLLNQAYSIDYVGKNIANLKAICNNASINNIETSNQLKNIKSVSLKKEPNEIIYLNEIEIKKIKEATIESEAFSNARKWLLLGCLIGQRGGDLLDITRKNLKEFDNIKIIELQQKKTKKIVAIPLLPEALEILEDGFPYKISLAKFNEYIKKVCEIAEINTPTTSREKSSSRGATIKKVMPKYKAITSHVCRRSFASNFYGKIPTPILMNITAHGSERMFMLYIGKTSYDNAYQMLEYFSKLKP
jgi:integrase